MFLNYLNIQLLKTKMFMLFLIGCSVLICLNYLIPPMPKTSATKFILYDSSSYKNYTHEYIIEETKKFADRQTEEDDPELIEFVKKLIKPPSTDKYNLRVSNKKDGDYSQEGQSLYIDTLLNQRTNGFFVGMFKIYLLLSSFLK